MTAIIIYLSMCHGNYENPYVSLSDVDSALDIYASVILETIDR